MRRDYLVEKLSLLLAGALLGACKDSDSRAPAPTPTTEATPKVAVTMKEVPTTVPAVSGTVLRRSSHKAGAGGSCGEGTCG